MFPGPSGCHFAGRCKPLACSAQPAHIPEACLTTGKQSASLVHPSLSRSFMSAVSITSTVAPPEKPYGRLTSALPSSSLAEHRTVHCRDFAPATPLSVQSCRQIRPEVFPPLDAPVQAHCPASQLPGSVSDRDNCIFFHYRRCVYKASAAVSPVRIRTTCSSSKTKILPSPILAV